MRGWRGAADGGGAARAWGRAAGRDAPGGARRLLLALVLALGALAGVPERAAAQVTAADTAAVLLEVARQLEAERQRALAEALYARILRLYPGSPAALEVEGRLAAVRRVRAEGDGRVELLVWSTAYGLWLGVAVPASLGAEGPEPYGAGLLVGGPAGFLAARALLRDRPLTEGQARAITFGGTWGTWQGFGWREVFELGNRTDRICVPDAAVPPSCYESEETRHEAVFGALVLGGLTGVGVGVALARTREIPVGKAALVNSGALWGTWYGTALGVLLDAEDDDLLAAALVGGNAGLLGTALLTPGWEPSRGRVRLVGIAGLAGLLGGFGIDLLVQPESERGTILIPMLTSAAGLAAGLAWTRDHDRPGPERPGDGAPGGGALLELDRGRWAWDLPMPVPALLESGPGGRRREPGVRLTLLQAAF